MKTFKKITTIFLTAVFLFSSFGFTISSIVCLKSGKGTVSLFVIEDCCAKKEVIVDVCCGNEEEATPRNVTFLEMGDCCDINNYSLKLNDYEVSQKASIEQPVIIHSLFLPLASEATSASSLEITFNSSNLPPPVFGRTLLNFISTLTI